MICPECNSEMSKKWQPKPACQVIGLATVLWACGICGHQVSPHDPKAPSKIGRPVVVAGGTLKAT